MGERPGSITVFFTLVLTVVISVLITSVSMARRAAASYMAALALESSVESVFAGYYLPLWEDYHLLFAADGAGLAEDVGDYLAYYEEMGLYDLTIGDIQVVDMIMAADNGGEVYLDAICEDMQLHGAETLVSLITDAAAQSDIISAISEFIYGISDYSGSLTDITEQYEELTSQSEQIAEVYDAVSEYIEGDQSSDEALESLESDIDELVGELSEQAGAQDTETAAADASTEGSTEEASEQTEETTGQALAAASIISALKDWSVNTVLSLALGTGADVSDSILASGEYPSGTIESSGAFSDSTLAALEQKAMLALYSTEHFSFYGSESDDTVLTYEAEYILCGETSDKANLAQTAERIFALRLGMDFIYLLTDSEKSAEAQTLAVALVGFTGISVLITAVQVILLAAWAVAEALTDTRTLFAGGTVAFIKTADDWQVSLSGIAEAISGTLENTGGQSSDGVWTYERYLQLLIFMEDGEDALLRSMDIIETDLRQADSNFYIENCVYYAEVSAEFEYGRYTISKTAAYGYQ